MAGVEAVGPGVTALRPGDAVIDVAATDSFDSLARAMTPAGTVVVVGPGPGDRIGALRRPLGAISWSRDRRRGRS